MQGAVDADMTLAIALNGSGVAPGGAAADKRVRPITWRTLRYEGGDVLAQCR